MLNYWIADVHCIAEVSEGIPLETQPFLQLPFLSDWESWGGGTPPTTEETGKSCASYTNPAEREAHNAEERSFFFASSTVNIQLQRIWVAPISRQNGVLLLSFIGYSNTACKCGTAPANRGHHRLLASIFPYNALRVNVKISHSTWGTVPRCSPPPPVPPPMAAAAVAGVSLA